MNINDLGKKIQKRRLELNLTQEQLAQKIGYKSTSTIAKIEKNINTIPFDKLLDFCKALDIPIYELLPENNNIEQIKYAPYVNKIIDLNII
ncbi:helix-turn-helix domain-containing protein, partial [Streptobacillus moniliformis]|uniref:helix-turn-helix domain-containing protein n=1 Tax=Streptobacillus moniliformis TaxID=34105 RepID=UPI000A405FE4